MEHNGMCASTGKLRFKTQSDARRAQRDRYDSQLLRAYRHMGKGACGDWHLGHSSVGLRKNRRNKPRRRVEWD